MATLMQEAAVDKLVELGGRRTRGHLSVSKAMRESKIPYSPATAKTPKKLTESKGFQEIARKKGLTAGLITGALVEDIKKKPQNRVPEMRLGADILGMTENKEGGNKTLIINITGETAKRYGIGTSSSASPNSVRSA